MWRAIIRDTRTNIAAALAAAATISLAVLALDGMRHSLSGWSAVALTVVFPVSFVLAWLAVMWTSRR